MTVKYLVVAHASRQDEIINLFLSTFPDAIKNITRCNFPIDNVYCYIYIEDYLETVGLVIRATPMVEHKHDVQLTIYQDIETIPLMNKAIADSKGYVLDSRH